MRRRNTVLEVLLLVACVPAGFVLFEHAARVAETTAAVAALRAIHVSSAHLVDHTSILVVPGSGAAFRAIVTPSCSSLASVLALGCLGAIIPSSRRVVPLAIAAFTVVVGNIVRIAASVGVGVFAGRSSLILFHDWVGSVFAFAYTLGGYMLLLYLLLPRRIPTVEVT